MFDIDLSEIPAAAIWLLVTTCWWKFSMATSRRFAPASSLAASVIHGLTIGLTTLVVWAFLLSNLKLLTGSAWLLVVLASSLAGLWFLRDRSGSGHAVQYRRSGPALHGVMITDLWHRIWLFAGAMFVAHVIIDGLLRIPTDFDCLMYHLPLMDEWLQARSLYNPESSYSWTPGNSELIGLWMVSPFSGDFLQALNNVPIVVLWGVATWELGRQLGLSRTWAHLATLAVFAVYTTLHETDDASNDLAVVAFTTAAMWYALNALRNDRLFEITGCGLQLGLLVGVKYFGLGYAGLIGGMLVGLTACRHGLRRGVIVAGWLLATSSLTGGYWYIRNTWVTGSPIAPLGLGGQMSGVGYPESTWRTTFLGNGSDQLWELGFSALWATTGPCHFAALALAPLVAVWLFVSSVCLRNIALARGQHVRLSFSRLRRRVLAGWLIGFGPVFLATPFCVEDQPGTLNHLRMAYTPARYGLSFLSIALIALVLLIQRTSAPLRPAFQTFSRFAFGMALLSQWTLRVRHSWYEFQFIDVLLLGVNLYLIAELFHHIASRDRHRVLRWTLWPSVRVAVAGTVVFAVLISINFLSQRWHRGLPEFYSSWFGVPFFTEILREDPARVKIAVFDLRIYPFFGSRRQFFVCRQRQVDSPADLVQYLQEHGVSHVATHPGRNLRFDLYRRVPDWMHNDPHNWEREGIPGSLGQYVIYISAHK